MPRRKGPATAVWPMHRRDAARSGVSDAPGIDVPGVRWSLRVGLQGYLNNPVIVGGRVVVGSSGERHNQPDALDGVVCVDLHSGREVWSAPLPLDACGVAVDGPTVFATCDDGSLTALELESGRLRWSGRRPGRLYAQPLVLDGRVLIGDSSGTVLCVDGGTGAVLWDAQVAASPMRSGLAWADGRLFATFVEGRVACLDADGRVLWNRELNEPHLRPSDVCHEIYASPLPLGDRVVVTFARQTTWDRPAVAALDVRTGRTIWRGTDPEGGKQTFGNIRSTPVAWDRFLLYGAAYSNELVALHAEDGRLAWSMELGRPMFPHWPSGAVAGETLYLPRHDGVLYAVDLKRRMIPWAMALGDAAKPARVTLEERIAQSRRDPAWEPETSPIYASPAVEADGTVVVGTGEGMLLAIEETART